MSIQTYTHEVMSTGSAMIPLWIIDDDGNIAREQGRFKPGDPVTHARSGGRGLVIGVVGHEVAVLWAEEPGPDVGLTRLPLRGFSLVYPSSIARDLIKVDPLPVPEGANIFYHDKDDE